MEMTRIKKSLSLILCVVLIAAMALGTVGCSDDKTNGDTDTSGTSAITTEAESADGTEGTTADADTSDETSGTEGTDAVSDVTVIGEGTKIFFFNVTDGDGNETKFEVRTDKTTVGEALIENDLIKGDDGDFGLYVKEVNGITADYDTDGTYWAFYVDGAYASSGVDSTEITEGATYAFKVEK